MSKRFIFLGFIGLMLLALAVAGDENARLTIRFTEAKPVVIDRAPATTTTALDIQPVENGF